MVLKLFLMKGLFLLLWAITLWAAQSSAQCNAGITSTTEDTSNTNPAIYVNANNLHDAECSGTAYAWHYCYYPTNSETNLEVAFGVFFVSSNVYTLRNGSYYLLHLDSRETSFTCDTVNLNPSQYFTISDGDRVGACMRGNEDIDYLDILFDTGILEFNYVGHWNDGSGPCTEDVMLISPELDGFSDYRSNNLHLYVDIDVDECALNRDNCNDLSATCSNVIGGDDSYECSCIAGYTGDGVTCNNIDECHTETDNCAQQASCMDTDGSFTCVCNTGYTGDGITCTDINECSTGTDSCSEQAFCMDTDGSFTCMCNIGYTGDGMTCNDIDECNSGYDNCTQLTSCVNTNGSFSCVCNTGYTGDGDTCYNIDECDAGTHNCAEQASCMDTNGSFTCTCNTGYTGVGITCSDIDECNSGSDNCTELTSCVNIDGNFYCVCTTRYTGDGVICNNIDECNAGTHNCAEQATCMDTDGSFTCTCNAGYTGSGITCTDVNECQDDSVRCIPNAYCINTAGSYTCFCQSGYTGDGETCNNIDECNAGMDNCAGQASCMDTDEGFMCTCDTGYTGDGITCSDIDECSTGNANCAEQASCMDTDGSFMCICNTGYTGNGITCKDINECQDGTDTCDSNANCTNTLGSFSCHCHLGYGGDGETCEASQIGGKEDDNKGLGVGKISGIAIGAAVGIVLLVLIILLFAVKLRKQMKIKIFVTARPQQNIQGIANAMYGVHQNWHEFNTCSHHSMKGEPSIYDYPVGEKSTSMELTSMKINSATGQELPEPPLPIHTLDCYTDVDYYCQVKELGNQENDYDDVFQKAKEMKNVDENEVELYYTPAKEEEEIYSQLRRQNIKAIPRSDIEQLDFLGAGEFGNVYRGRWSYIKETMDVAIKMLAHESDEQSKVKFLQEAAIMSQFRHPNVIKLYGVVNDDDGMLLIVELLKKGDLRHFLKSMKPEFEQFHHPSTAHTLLSFCRQVALGMVYLSGKGFVHRDLAARNILVSHNNICKISDFGMSRDLEEENYYVSQGGKVPLKWTAPEALYYKRYSTASDIWSYGCLMYEIWSIGHKPFEEQTNAEAIRQMDSGYRLPPPPGCPKEIYTHMINCWNPDPKSRPKFQQILLTLLGDDNALLAIPEEDKDTHTMAGVLGSPLEAGYSMYLQEQHRYLINEEDMQQTKL